MASKLRPWKQGEPWTTSLELRSACRLPGQGHSSMQYIGFGLKLGLCNNISEQSVTVNVVCLKYQAELACKISRECTCGNMCWKHVLETEGKSLQICIIKDFYTNVYGSLGSKIVKCLLKLS